MIPGSPVKHAADPRFTYTTRTHTMVYCFFKHKALTSILLRSWNCFSQLPVFICDVFVLIAVKASMLRQLWLSQKWGFRSRRAKRQHIPLQVDDALRTTRMDTKAQVKLRSYPSVCNRQQEEHTLLFKHMLKWWSDNVIVKAWRNVNVIPWMVLLLYLNCCFYCLVEGIGTENLLAVL